MSKLFDRVFKDKKGNVVLWQSPNVQLAAWFILYLISKFVGDINIKSSLSLFANLFLVWWAIKEVIWGINYFRRALGAAIIALLVLNLGH